MTWNPGYRANDSRTPLVVTLAKCSSGCTGVEWPKDAILPGATGEINATFNAAAVGAFNKTVTVESNSDGGTAMLTFKGEVVADEKSGVNGR